MCTTVYWFIVLIIEESALLLVALKFDLLSLLSPGR
jgi:hypothetical protein